MKNMALGLEVNPPSHIQNNKRSINLDDSKPNFFSSTELERFSKHGIIGPIKLMEPSQANDLKEYIKLSLANPNNSMTKIRRNVYEGQRDELFENNDVLLGVNMFMYDERVRSVLSSENMKAAMSELLNTDNVLCWRSQIFRQNDMKSRTFIHQNVDFAESFNHTSLAVKNGKRFDPNSALTTWISLTDASPANGCLISYGGSFVDTRLYDLSKHFLNNKKDAIEALSFLPVNELIDTISILLFSKGAHRGKTKILMRLSELYYDDLFSNEIQKTKFISKPGEAWIFTSFNLHGSDYSTTTDERYTLVGRYVNGDVIDVGKNDVMIPMGNKPIFFDPEEYGWKSKLRL